MLSKKVTPARVDTASDWAVVAAGSVHTVALKTDGTLWAWGHNHRGQLGDGTTVDQSRPLQVGTDRDWAAVAPGDDHTVGVKTDGKFWSWGGNSYGSLGDGTMELRSTPVRVALPELPVAISDIASPGAAARAVNSQGEIVGVYAPAASTLGRAYAWTPMAGLSDLGTLGGDHSRAYDINSHGDIAGEAKDPGGRSVGFRLRPLDLNGIPVWYQDANGDSVNDLMEPLEYQEYQVEITAINNTGIIGGDYYNLGTPTCKRGVLWLPENTPVDLGGPINLQTIVSDLNDAGVVVGSTGTAPSSQTGFHPFLVFPQDRNGLMVWYEDINSDGRNDLILELEQFDGYTAKAINNAGTVCLKSSGIRDSLLWRNGVVVATLSPGDGLYCRAYALNDHEQIVGRLETSGGAHSEAFIWTTQLGFIKLPGLGGSISSAYAIDPTGTIVVGVATDAAGTYHGVRWLIPVNTPQGSGVSVWVESDSPGMGSVGVTLPNVTCPGTTVLSSSTTGPDLPSGFKLGDPPVFCELASSASFEGMAQVCFSYQQSAFLNELTVRLFHYEGGEWQNVTTFLDTVNNMVCGRVASFSPFVILENALVVTIEEPASGFPARVNTPVTFTGSFIDTQGAGSYAAYWTFSSGTALEYAVPATISGGVVQDQIMFATPGVYTVKLTVAGAGLPAEATTVANDLPAYVVIYDPSGGFVIGGGWISSPAGAYVADPALVGKGTFGFVAKYQRGANVPTGNTEFQFKAGSLNFKSTDYQWLVVAGARAQFKGWGTINGQGHYAFILTAIDGQITGGGWADRFRIKIWDEASGLIVYDNQVGTDDTAGLVGDGTLLQGGSIVIQKK
jgi:probable HAF family extracellular repeat protein